MGKSKSKSGGARNYTPLLTARPKGMSYQEIVNAEPIRTHG